MVSNKSKISYLTLISASFLLVLSFCLIRKEVLFLNINFFLVVISFIIGLSLLLINRKINIIINRKKDRPNNQYKNLFDNISMHCNIYCWILYIFSLSCFEEIIFRFYLINWLIQWVTPLIACLVSSIVFSLAHLRRLQIIQLTLMGFCFSILYLKTDNIIYPIIAHFTNNFIIYLLLRKKYISINKTHIVI